MAEVTQGGGAAAAPVGGGVETTAPANAQVTQADAGSPKVEDAEYWKSEAKKAFSERDEWKRKAKPADDKPAKSKAPNADPIAEMQAELRFRDALMDSGIALSKDQREIMRTLYTAQSPAPEEVDAWIETTAGKLGARKGASAPATSSAAQPPPRREAVTNTGAPGAVPTNKPMDTPEAFAMWSGLSSEEKKKQWANYVDKSQGSRGWFSGRPPRKG